jgi:hypothetical protein
MAVTRQSREVAQASKPCKSHSYTMLTDKASSPPALICKEIAQNHEDGSVVATAIESGCIPVESKCTRFKKNFDKLPSHCSFILEESFTQEERVHRSIFQNYWKQVGGDGPCSARLQDPHSPRAVIAPFRSLGSTKCLCCDDDDIEQEFSSYERILRNDNSTGKKEEHGLLMWPLESRPLPISGSYRGSLPTLFENSVGYRRSTKSDSEIYVRPKPLPSCLRASRYSFHQNSAIRASHDAPDRSAVAFKPQVEVVQFERDLEAWAPEGWSSLFDYRTELENLLV